MHGTGFHRRQGIRHGQFPIIVGVNPQRKIKPLPNRLKNGADLRRQRSPVGIAQHQGVGTPVRCGLKHAKGKIGVVFVPIEKVFGVKNDPAATLTQKRHRAVNEFRIFIIAQPQRIPGMKPPRFTKDSHHFRFRCQ